MKIKQKLWLGFGLLIALFSSLGLYQNLQLGKLGDSALAVFEYPLKSVDRSRAAWDLFRSSRDLVSRELQRIEFSDARQAEAALARLQQQFEVQFQEARQASTALMVDTDFEQIHAWAQQWYQLNKQRIGANRHTQLPDERVLTKLDMQLGSALDQLVNDSLAAAAMHKQQTVELISQTRELGTVLLISAIGLGVGLAIWLALSLSRPLQLLLSAIFDLARGEGDLTRRLNLSRNDEIGELSNEIDLFIAKIHALVSDTRQAAHDAQHTVSGFGQLTDNTHRGVAQQRSRLDETTLAMEQMTSTVQSMKNNSHVAKEQAELISRDTQQGLLLVNEASQGINQLAREVDNASQSIQQLAADSNNISELITVIDEIADQTNLLALNAAIEAARAGDAGRGFAVVADEVRALAMKTRESTENIQRTITTIQARVGEARDVMDQGSALAVTCVDQSNAVSTALNQISTNVTTIEQMNLDIDAETEQQRASMEQINGYMASVSQVADETADTANELHHGRGQLELALGKVNERMAQFML